MNEHNTRDAGPATANDKAATLTMTLRADNGYQSVETHRVSAETWARIVAIAQDESNATAHMTPVELLALFDKFMSGAPLTDVEMWGANCVALAAAFGSAAFMASMDADQGTAAMLRALLTSLIDPLSPDLDYLRADPASGPAARSGGAA